MKKHKQDKKFWLKIVDLLIFSIQIKKSAICKIVSTLFIYFAFKLEKNKKKREQSTLSKTLLKFSSSFYYFWRIFKENFFFDLFYKNKNYLL